MESWIWLQALCAFRCVGTKLLNRRRLFFVLHKAKSHSRMDYIWLIIFELVETAYWRLWSRGVFGTIVGVCLLGVLRVPPFVGPPSVALVPDPAFFRIDADQSQNIACLSEIRRRIDSTEGSWSQQSHQRKWIELFLVLHLLSSSLSYPWSDAPPEYVNCTLLRIKLWLWGIILMM